MIDQRMFHQCRCCRIGWRPQFRYVLRTCFKTNKKTVRHSCSQACCCAAALLPVEAGVLLCLPAGLQLGHNSIRPMELKRSHRGMTFNQQEIITQPVLIFNHSAKTNHHQSCRQKNSRATGRVWCVLCVSYTRREKTKHRMPKCEKSQSGTY